MAKPGPVLAHAMKDVFAGRLTLMALLNLVIALAIVGGAAFALITTLVPLIPEREGWIGAAFNASEIAVGVGVVVVALVLSPAVSMIVGGMLFDVAAARVEKAIGAPPGRMVPIGEGVANGFRIGLPALGFNILAIPLYFIPVVNLITFVALNGFLMGREYAALAAVRRMSWQEARAFRRRNGLSVFVLGLACSLIPFFAPLIGASAMTRLVVGRS